VVMIILTVFAQKQFHYIRNADLGFDRERIIRFQVSDPLREKYDLFKERLLQNPRVLNVTAASALPHLLFNVNNLEWEGMNTENPVEVNFLYVDQDYAETFGLQIVKGRDFSKEFPTDSSEAFVVNESALPLLGFKDPLGKKLILAGREGRIIGVVKDFNFMPLIFKISPLVMAVRPEWYFDLLVKISPEEMPRTLAYVGNVFKEFTPGFPFDYIFIDDIFNRVYSPLEFVNGILNAFTGLALFISCLGLFGLASLLTEQRRKEVGIRKVLGASASGILALLSRKFVLTILAANVIAVPISYFITRQFLNLFVYRTEIDPFVFLAAASITFAVALATVSFQVLKTARVNPAECLHYE
jgi:putative ABC transport system permease protein